MYALKFVCILHTRALVLAMKTETMKQNEPLKFLLSYSNA
jgi:hypothetical protein